MMLHRLLRPFGQLLPQLLRQRRWIAEVGIIDVDIFCDDRFDPAANPICSFTLLKPNRLQQIEYMAWLDL